MEQEKGAVRNNARNDVMREVLAGAVRSPGYFNELGHIATRSAQARSTQLQVVRTRILLTTALTTALAGLIPNQAKAAICSTNITASCTVTQSQSLGTLTNSGNSIGALTNNGTIHGGRSGINNEGSISALINSGSVQGGLSGILNGAIIGTLSNSGSIHGNLAGIVSQGATISLLSNSGTISGSYAGIVNSDGMISTLVNGGVIHGGDIDISNGSGTIGTLINAGSIISAGENVVASGQTFVSPPLSIYNTGGTIGTLIDAGLYNEADGVSITNDGTITASESNVSITGNAAGLKSIVGIYNTGSITALTNDSTGSISGGSDGIYNASSISALINNGAISGSFFGIFNLGATNGTLTTTIGTLTNNGTISGGLNGVVSERGSIGVLTNSGTISGSFAGVINFAGSIDALTNNGTISAGSFGVYNEDGSSIGTLSNSSVISGNSVGIFNRNSGTLAATIGVLTNNGTISGGKAGVGNTDSSIGTLNNNGTISGGFVGVVNSGSVEGGGSGSIGRLTNNGSISGGKLGVFNLGSSIDTLSNSGVISGSSAGVVNSGSVHGGGKSSIGTLTNSGTIAGGFTGVVNYHGSIGVLANSGIISGTSVDIYNESGTIGTLINAGSIASAGANAIASGETVTAVALSVDNTGGTISNLIGAGLYNGTDGVSITNDGTIIGSTSNVSITGNAAGSTRVVGIYNAGSISALSNNGMITGAQGALYIAPGGSIGQLTDSGMIAGNIDNESSQAVKISGGTGTDYGMLTGYNGTTGSITSTIAGADLTFGTGNLLLDDNINVGGNSVIDTGATLLVDGLSSIVSASPLDIAGGLLEVGDATHNDAILNSNVAIGSAGELRGHGTITGDVTNDGVVYPGGSMGILTIDGNYLQNSDGTLEVEVSPVTTAGTGYDQLAVAGSAKLGGALEVNVDSGAYIAGDQYDIATVSGGISGTFSMAGYTASFSTALKQYLTPTLNYTANDVYLNLVPTVSAFSTGRFYAASAYAQNNALQSVLGAPFGMNSGENEVDRGYWLHGIGNFGSDNGYGFNAKGFVVGKGFNVSPNLVIGGAVSNVYTSTNGGGSSVNGTSFGVLIYGLYNAGRLSLSASAGAGHMSDNINRYLPSLGWQGKAASNGAYEGVDAQLQYSLLSASSPYFLAPYAQASYLHTALGSAQETNAGILNLHYDALSTSLAQLGAGITGGYNVPIKYGMLTAWASLGGLGTLGNPHASVTEQMGTYTARETALATPAGALNPGVGLQLIGNSPWRLAAGWSGLFGSATSAENLTLQASYKW